MKQKKNRRRAFSPSDYDRMCQVAQERIDAAPDDRQRHQRTVLLDFLIVVRFSGLRPHEAYGLTWANVNMEEQVLHVTGGKTGEREVALLDDEAIDRLKLIRRRHTRQQGGCLDHTTSLFAGFTGEPTRDVKKAFGTLLRACNF